MWRTRWGISKRVGHAQGRPYPPQGIWILRFGGLTVSKRTSVLGIGESRDAGSPLLVHSTQKLLHIGGQ